MKLYDLKAGLNPRRVRIFLAEKGIDIPIVPIDMAAGENATPEFLKLNPLGKLPVLVLDDGTVLTESVAICRYLESLHPEPPLFGRTPLEQAQVEMWNRRMEHEILVHVTNMFRHTHPFWIGRQTQFKDFGEWSRNILLDRMRWLDGELAEREFVAGDTYTVADITAQCALLVAKACKVPIPEDMPNLAAWWSRVTSRPSARA
ncbi:glutathione S-transferase family protein [Futiania mangrovi]|uniref:Glutathione S-transferase family protein n=1 Tax=Futiania mangrovi TaxID=2959716 RepID=A0A9J6PAR9_9PROT|nr:glutathione S-transferase family protein [Futiania mangrovii]MCP1335537.1 glutathione S-transferase family protein [Futiania mangrovii]